MILDFRKKKTEILPLTIHGNEIEIVEEFKFLGTTISHDLKWEKNTDRIVKKAQQRLYFLRRLKKFGVHSYILFQFYRAVIESVLTFSIVVWYSSTSEKERTKLNKIVRTASRIIGTDLPSMETIYEKRLQNKAMSISQDALHPAFGLFELLPSGRRYRSIKTKTSRFANSFFPQAVLALSKSQSTSEL